MAALVALKHVAAPGLDATGRDVGENPALLGRGCHLAAETLLVGSHDNFVHKSGDRLSETEGYHTFALS